MREVSYTKGREGGREGGRGREKDGCILLTVAKFIGFGVLELECLYTEILHSHFSSDSAVIDISEIMVFTSKALVASLIFNFILKESTTVV